MTATQTATPTFGEKLRKAREDAGMTRDRAARRLELDFGITVSVETIRRYETGFTTVDHVDIPLVLGLADIYRVKPSSLSPVISRRAKSLRDLLGRMTACITGADATACAA